ncbi:MAG: Asp-tRNA(Asn)/Glu-tRNA(Gln) amidotransferase GatCAB subunit A [Gammaproteobacteria bacterium]|nr:MAG: Asp-tRNA(Asn)/Glu-tRNA(Gln) amidotransferase GatCAB subunit A [Gammaproteobacteria bacterium]
MRYKTLTQLRQQLDDQRLSAVELCQETLALINDDPTNAVISTCDALALAQAESADNHIDGHSRNNNNALLGIPVIYKDNFNVKDYPTTCASRILQNHISVYDATVVDLMQQQGSLSIAKANMDEFAMGSTNETSTFGAVSNPFNDKHCTGGSSGGSAAAVANGLVPVSFGTDTGGSVRQPAALCGVVGLKPTYGRLSRFGIVAFGSSFDQPGIFSHTAEDAAIVLSATAHYDDKDSTSVNVAGDNYSERINQPLHGKKVGVVNALFERIDDKSIQRRLQGALDTYQQQGIELVDVELPDPQLCVAAYYVLSSSECSSNLSRFDGVRYGYRSPNSDDLQALYTRSRSEGFGTEVKRRILLGTFALSSGYYDAYYRKAQKMRRAILNQFNRCFEQVDSILLPTSLSTAPALGRDFDYNDDMCTITANLAGLPAISHPVGFADDGLPVGLQIIGKHFAEGTLLNMTHRFQLETDFHLIHP